jgi:hypothetical protein
MVAYCIKRLNRERIKKSGRRKKKKQQNKTKKKKLFE